MRIFPIILICVTICLASCGSKTDNRDSKQDSLAIQKSRAESKRSYMDSVLHVAQQDLAKTDSALQIVKAEHDNLQKKITSQVTSAAEGNRLTQLRLKRDSLQIRFEVLCAQIRYIHLKQGGC